MKQYECSDRSISICVREKRLVMALYAISGMLLAMCNGGSSLDNTLKQGVLFIAEELELHAKMIIELVRSSQKYTSIDSVITATDDLSRAIDKYESALKLKRAEQ